MKDVIKKVAEENGTSVAAVEKEMEYAIAYAMNLCCDDCNRKKLWNELSPDGNIPTIEEFIIFMAQKVTEK